MTHPYFDDQHHVDSTPAHRYWARGMRWAYTPAGRESKYWTTCVAYGAGPSGLDDHVVSEMDYPRLPRGYTWGPYHWSHGERSAGGIERLARAQGPRIDTIRTSNKK